MPADWSDLDRRAVDTIRVLAADAVQKVGNGHPGTAMSLAPLAYSLFQRVMRHDPSDADWPGRDRFVLSCGHSSITLYIQLYLSGYGLEMADLKALRTWGSKTPGHPEHGHTRGVEITTGPLGQGLASAVGMAMAARRERGLFDPDPGWGDSPFDHYIYVIASDGDIEEGVTSEASSLAGTQELGNLILFYDDNKISIEDDTTIALSEDTAKPLRGLRLARAGRGERRGRHRHPEGRRGGQGRDLAAVVHRAEDRDRLARAEEDEHLPGARLRAGRRRGRRGQGDPALRPRRVLPDRRRGARRTPARSSSADRTRTPRGRRRSTSGRRASPSARSCSTGSPPGSCRRAGRRRCRPGSPTRRACRRARPPARC